MTLEVLPYILAIVRLDPTTAIPLWGRNDPFFSICKTEHELSYVGLQHSIPSEVEGERNWRAIKVAGPLDFKLTGILAGLSSSLATAQISIFALSTYDTDYILVKEENVSKAMFTLARAGNTFITAAQRKVFAEGVYAQPELSSDRLQLEPITIRQASAVHELLSDPELYHFVPYQALSLEQQTERCRKWERRLSPAQDEVWLNWLAKLKDDQGAVTHFQVGIKHDGTVSIGYTVAKKYQRQGFAFEGLRLVLNFLKTNFQIIEVKAWSDTRNFASHQLLIKLGFEQIDLIKDADFFRGASSDEFVFSKILEGPVDA